MAAIFVLGGVGPAQQPARGTATAGSSYRATGDRNGSTTGARTVVARGIPHPFSLLILPDGDMLVSERSFGKLHAILSGRVPQRRGAANSIAENESRRICGLPRKRLVAYAGEKLPRWPPPGPRGGSASPTAERNGKRLDVMCCIVFEIKDGRDVVMCFSTAPVLLINELTRF